MFECLRENKSIEGGSRASCEERESDVVNVKVLYVDLRIMDTDQFPVVSIYDYRADLSDIDHKSLLHVFNITKYVIDSS